MISPRQPSRIPSQTDAGGPISSAGFRAAFAAARFITSVVQFASGEVAHILRNAQRKKARLQDNQQPPASAKFLLLLIPKKYREYLLGDLEEEYRTVVVKQYPIALARFW